MPELNVPVTILSEEISPRTPRKRLSGSSVKRCSDSNLIDAEETDLISPPVSAREASTSLNGSLRRSRDTSGSQSFKRLWCPAESEFGQAITIPRIVKAEHSVHQQQKALLVQSNQVKSPIRKKKEENVHQPLLLSRLNRRRSSFDSRLNKSPSLKSLNADILDRSLSIASLGSRRHQMKLAKNKELFTGKQQLADSKTSP